MNQTVFHYLRWAGLVLALTLVVTLVVLMIGWFGKWNTVAQFSNGFFAAGMILAVIGILSVAGGFAQRANFGILYSQSAGDASLGERAQRMVADIQQGYGVLVLLAGSGLLLMVISVAVNQLFGG